MFQQEVEELFFFQSGWCLHCYVMVGGDQIPEPTYYRATNFTQTPKKNKNEFWNCHLAVLGRVAKPMFTSLCPGQPLRV